MNLFDVILEEDQPLNAVKNLVRKGADLNALDEYGASPLMRAAEMDQAEVVQFLLDHGADVDLKDDDGRTALDYAMEDEIGDMLFEAGCVYGQEDHDDELEEVDDYDDEDL